MSMAAESPLHSSNSSDDFAALIDAELESAASNTYPDQEDDVEDDTDDGSGEEERIKRRKVEDYNGAKELHGSTSATPVQQESETFTIDKETNLQDICPPHPGFFKGLCMRCGQLEEDASGVAYGYIHKDLKLGTTEIDRLRGADLKKLLRDQKLILVLDLDHTLLNSTRLVDLSLGEEYLLRHADSILEDPNRSLFKMERMHMLTKLRPYVHNFLREASSMFDMYIYTMGEYSYALEMASLLDPQRVYFDSKVISQADCTQRHQKGLDVVLGHESTVVILDDTEMVWSRHKDNLILMERYHYFASSCRQFSFKENSLSELKRDEREADGALANILNVLKRTHQLFFDPECATDLSNRDVRQALKKIRKEVLQGCKVVFSRLFSSNSRAEDQQIWKLAEQLGATCCTEVDLSVTHIVAMNGTTEKARWAVENDKFLVHPRWIEAAHYLWKRLPETDFPVSNVKNQ